MNKRLVITEKPSVARDIVAALGGFQEEEGYWESEAFVVTFAVGHLFELLEPEDLDPKYKRWTLDTLPIIPEKFELKPKKEHNDRLKTIKALFKRKDIGTIVNACDAGREGELIFREIIDFNEVQNPIERLWLQSMTTGAIRDGMNNLKPGEQYRGLRDAAYCRTYSDWLIGMNATRALTRRLKTRTETQAWSAGRVQTPTLAMLVDRELEVLGHQPQPFWRIVGRFAHTTHSYPGTWFDPSKGEDGEEAKDRPDRIFDEAKAAALLAKVTGKQGIASETRKPSKEAAPPLFDLTSLQREANRRFGWSARRTLNAAQRCYEAHKVLTYPRTDARALPNDYRPVVDTIIGQLKLDGRFSQASRYLEKNGLQNESKIFDDTKVRDHFAIVPTGVLPEAPLDGDDGRIFELVTRRFLAAFHPPATWSKVERLTVVEGEQFRSRARTLQDPGWRSVMGEEAVDGTAPDEDRTVLPPLVAAQDVSSDVAVGGESFESVAEETKPAPRITEGRLLGLMENAGEQVENEDAAEAMREKGIGTPATRADIIENLIRKGYVARAGKALKPIVKGIRLIDILRRMHADRLASPRLTGEMEQHLLEVERTQREPNLFMDEIREYTREIVERTKTFEFEDLFPDVESLGDCPLCKRPVYERSWFYRCLELPELQRVRRTAKDKDDDAPPKPAPTVEDCAFRIWKDKSGRYIDRTTVVELLAQGKTRILDGFTTRQGRTYRGQLTLENGEVVLQGVAGGEGDEGSTETPEYEVDDTPLAACPVCKTGEVVETRATFICSKGRDLLRRLNRDEASLFSLKKRDIPEDAEYCTFLFPRTVCKREITRDDALTYLKDGKTALLTDFISQRGRPFSATLVLKPETGRHGFEFPPRAKKEGEEGEAKPKRFGKGKKGAAEAPAEGEEAVAAAPPKKLGKAKARKAAAKAAKAGDAPAPKAGSAKKAPAKKAAKKAASKKAAPPAAAAPAPAPKAAAKPSTALRKKGADDTPRA